jgi:Cys-rich four helix bundle protein (predicted Tat secretion target)
MILAGAGLIAASGAASAQTSHDHHDHAGANPLLDTATACVKTGMICVDHCLQSFAAGDTSLAACARLTDQLVSVCSTLAKLASIKSPHLPAMAKLALAACADCEAECRKHDKHPPCMACAEACAACSAECKKVGA